MFRHFLKNLTQKFFYVLLIFHPFIKFSRHCVWPTLIRCQKKKTGKKFKLLKHFSSSLWVADASILAKKRLCFLLYWKGRVASPFIPSRQWSVTFPPLVDPRSTIWPSRQFPHILSKTKSKISFFCFVCLIKLIWISTNKEAFENQHFGAGNFST